MLRPNISKMPGALTKTKSDVHVHDLTKLTIVQLIEIKDREEKLLAKFQLARLPDKGKKIISFYEKVLKEISHRDEINKAANLFSDLNITATGEEKLTNLEWTGKLNTEQSQELVLDSDDEETDPLKIISQSTDIKKQIKYIEPVETLITQEDLQDIEEMQREKSNNNDELVVDSEIVYSKILKDKLDGAKLNGNLSNEAGSSNSSLNLEPHALYLFGKSIDSLPTTEKFLPFKTTKSNVHDPEKEKLRKIGGKHWEITAATPPPIQNSSIKLISLQDSVEIQTEYLEKLKKLQENQAVERLAARVAKQTKCDITLPDEEVRKVNKFFGSYRHQDLSSDESDIEDPDEGVYDDDDEPGGCVNFTVYK